MTDETPLLTSVSPPPAELVNRPDTATALPDGRRSRRFGPLRRRPQVEAVRPDRCPNCGAYPLMSRFCPDCGQENVSFKVPLPLLLADAGEEFAKWDGRLVRTIGLLLFRPGSLTDEYNQGRRTRCLPPFKMYFVASAIFVALLSVVNPMSDDAVPDRERKSTRAVQAGYEPASEAQADKKHKPATLDKSAKDILVAPVKTAKRKTDSGELTIDAGKGNQLNFDGFLDGKHDFDGYKLRPRDLKYNGHSAEQGQYAAAFDGWLTAHKPARTTWKTEVLRRILHLADHPGSLASNFIGNLGKGIFFLMPFYAAFLALFFRGQKRFYIEHLIFAVHLHTFAFVLGTLYLLVQIKSVPLATALLLTYPVYEFLSLRRIYGNGKRLTLFKMWLLNQFYGLVLLMGFILLFLVTAATL